MDENLFSLILDKNEQILKVYRPNRKRTWFTMFTAFMFFSVLLSVPSIIGSILDHQLVPFLIGTIVAYVIVLLICVPFIGLWLNKTVYAVTSKRILIRTGFIGVDFKSLDYTMLGALTVNVNWIDKLLRKNTGSIAFGSMASPMTNQAVAKFNFSYIHNPYETYREIKEIIDTHKDQ